MSGTWPFRVSAKERLLVVRQAKSDVRNIRPVWYHVFLPNESLVDGVFLQTPKILREFFQAIPAYFYIEMEDDSEAVETGVDRRMNIRVGISRAETYRLAQVLGELGFDWTEPQYRPRAQDVFQWRDDFYVLQDTAQPKTFWGTTTIALTYESPATKMRLDASAPETPLVIKLEQPPLGYPKDFFKALPDGEET